MAIPKFYINNALVKEPLEYRGLEVQLNFENIDEVEASITQDGLKFVLDNADILNTYLTNVSGAGVFYGLPFRIEIGSPSQIIFDGYIDLTEGALFSCEKVEAKIREAEKIDWIEKVADGFGFDLLDKNGLITEADYIKIPYILSDIPDYRQAALYFLYSFVLERELENLFQRGKDIVADLSGFFTTIAGVLKLILYLAHLIAVIAAIIVLVKNLVEELISPVRFHHGMMIKTHFEKACLHLGLTFKSSIFDKTVPTNNELDSGIWDDMCLEPEKRQVGFKRNKSTDEVGYWQGTFGDFLRGMLETFNARFRITNSVFHFERRDWSISTAVYQIPDVRRDFHGINAGDMFSNYLLQFQIDNQELNTVNSYKGTNAKNYTEHKTIFPDFISLISGLKQPQIPFALGRRKDELTRVEKLIDGLLTVLNILLTPLFVVADLLVDIIGGAVKAINAIISVINVFLSKSKKIKKIKVPNSSFTKVGLGVTLKNRIGMLKQSSDFIGIPKLILVTGSGFDVKIAVDNDTRLSAETMWNFYHYIESFVPTKQRPNGNQAFIFNIPVIPFCIEDFNLIRGVNNDNEGEAKVLSPDGNDAKILSLKWNLYNNKASIRYEESKLYTENLTETLLINEGN